MAERTKISEFWMCATDDGLTGDGESVATRFRVIPPDEARRMGAAQAAGSYMLVPFITYERSMVQRMVNKCCELGKPFRVLHFAAPQDVTEQYVPAWMSAGGRSGHA